MLQQAGNLICNWTVIFWCTTHENGVHSLLYSLLPRVKDSFVFSLFSPHCCNCFYPTVMPELERLIGIAGLYLSWIQSRVLLLSRLSLYYSVSALFAWGCSSVPCSNDFNASLMPIYESKFHFTLVNPELLYMNQYKDSVAYFGTNQDLIHWLCCSDGVHDWTDG